MKTVAGVRTQIAEQNTSFLKLLLTATAGATLMLALTAQADAQVIEDVVGGVTVDLSVLEDGGAGPVEVGTPPPTLDYVDRRLKMPGPSLPQSTLHVTVDGAAQKSVQAPKLIPPKVVAADTRGPQLPTADPDALVSRLIAKPPVEASVGSAPAPLTPPAKPPASEIAAAPPPPSLPAPPKMAEPKVEVAKAEPKALPKSEPKPEPKPEPKIEAKPEPAPAPAPAPKPEVKAEPAPEPMPKSEAKTEPASAPVSQPKTADAPPPPAPAMPEPKPLEKLPEPAPEPKEVAAAEKAPAAPPAPPAAPALTPPQVPKASAPIPAASDEPAKTETASLPPVTIEIGKQIRVAFTDKSVQLPSDGEPPLTALAKAMQAKSDLRVQIIAYAGGNDISASAARRLSLSRALEVRNFLREQGVKTTRIDVRALGNKTTEEPVNRVDLTVTER